jgi:hypothetical protein
MKKGASFFCDKRRMSYKVAIYSRASTKEQVGEDKISLNVQKQICERWCERNGFPVYQSFSEVSSAYRGEQEQLREAITCLRKGARNITKLLVVSAVDRFSRNLSRGRELLLDLHKANIVLVIADSELRSDENLDDILLGIRVGEQESRNKGDRVRAANAFRQQDVFDEWPWFRGKKAPFGYDIVTMERPSGKGEYTTLAKNDDYETIVAMIARVFDLVAEHYVEEAVEMVATEFNFVLTPRQLLKLYNEHIENISCTKCKSSRETKKNPILLCEKCASGMHAMCLGSNPEKYVCPKCVPPPPPPQRKWRSFAATKIQRKKFGRYQPSAAGPSRPTTGADRLRALMERAGVGSDEEDEYTDLLEKMKDMDF